MTKKATKIVGVLNANNILVGSKVVPLDADGIEIGDLKADGSMKYLPEARAFIPMGHGHGKVKTKPPADTELVLANLIEALAVVPGFELPHVASEWLEWYNADMRRRHEEMATRPR